MSNVDLPHGVPSPVHAHVHPYPTRYHGSIWTRPRFGFPWARTPYEVFRPSQMDGMGAYIDPVFRPYHGLGQHWDAADGVFRRPSYDGGGVFNKISGLGAAPATQAGAFFGAAAVAFAVTAFLLKR